MGQLDDATKAHRAAQERLATAKSAAEQRIRTARAEVESSRLALAAAIVAEANQGTPQVEIIRRTGYARETVRQILRDGGVEPD
jgi:CRP-like cAMP-binding protein